MFPPQEGQTTMAIVKSSTLANKSANDTKTNSKEDQMAASTATMPRYAVFSLSGKSKTDEWTSYFLSVSPEAPLSAKEKAALLDAFDIAVGGRQRKNFDPSYFRGKNAAMAKTGVFGGELYWLAGEETMDLKVAKNNVLEILGSPDGKKAGKPAAQQPQGGSKKGKAASGGKKGKDTQAEAAKGRQAKRNAYTVVLG